MLSRYSYHAFSPGVKKLRVRVTQCLELIRVDDMCNVSPLSWIGTPDISSLGPYNIHDIWHRNLSGSNQEVILIIKNYFQLLILPRISIDEHCPWSWNEAI